jgi:Tfp pilus assembly protein PilF
MIIIVVLTTLAYLNIFSNSFAWDDKDTILNWQATRTFTSIPSMLAGAVPPGHPGNYRPVRNILYIVSYKLWGENPWGYHLQTLLLTVGIALLVYGITDLLIPNSLVPLVTALLFGLHPMHVEALTWITSSMDMFGMLFGFAGVYQYLYFRRHPKKWLNYVYAFIFTALALFSNEIDLSIPILLFLIAYLFPKPKQSRLWWMHLVPFFGLIIGNFYIRAVILHIGSRFSYLGNSITRSFLVMMRATWVYITTLIYPTNLTINHSLGKGLSSWGVELIELGSMGQRAVAALRFSDPIVITSIVCIVLSLGFAFFIRRKHPLIAFAIFWSFVAILPAANIIPTEAMMTERYAFLSSFGFCLLLAMGIDKIGNLSSLSKPKNQIAWAVVAIILIFYMQQTMLRNSQWKNNEILWQSTTQSTPDALLPHLYLAEQYVAKGDIEKALEQYLTARELSPKQSDIDLFIAAMYHTLGKDQESIIYLVQAIKKNPWNVEGYFRLGNIYKLQENWDKAIEAYKTGLKVYPDHTLMLNNLGVIYSIQGKNALAIQMYEQALRVDPNYESAKQNLLKLKGTQ